MEQEAYHGTVTYVYDGDTCAVSVATSDIPGGYLAGNVVRTVRLADVDTPEKGNEPSYTIATQALKDLIDGKSIHVRVVAVDRYGRDISYVTVADSMGLPIDVNERMSEYNK